MEVRTFTIPGKPVGKGRPRFCRNGTYTPEKTANYETLVKWAYAAVYPDKHLFEGPVELVITAYYAIPQSWPKKKQMLAELGDIRPVIKPDADNVVKAISDALNGLAYKDDAQVATVRFDKWYGNPRVEVDVWGQEP